MDRQRLELIIKSEECIEGGIKEACIKVREVLINRMNPGNQLHAPLSCVNIEEFVKAVDVLATYAAQKKDEKVELYRCDSNCTYIYCKPCPGRFITGDIGSTICPYYVEEDK